ncbi:four-carbon acid sugar kinase family protein [uncultured Jannaschia sp.]|uniref:four-carbon acid sugar kinase family protein n=1 Tax=uncultured Jannaschia sp. TaxID=293347 RepID=UPI002602F0AC|nr:four-carbon acid sugar kinase family protein [uncultured Jannaschia sp.]
MSEIFEKNSLPAEGPLVAWYGDDFTGSSAVAEVLTFAGLPSVLFLETPTAEQLARFRDRRGIGIAGVARAHGPQWMERELPAVFEALASLGAPITHYKVCSTLDSAPQIGSIGKAIDIGRSILDSAWTPVVIAAPAIARYQVFGNLFAIVDGIPHRLDRHPTMSRHPVTPMNEADVRRHLQRQTEQPLGLIDILALHTGNAGTFLDKEMAAGRQIVVLDVIDDETLRAAGALVWERRGEGIFAVGSQGLEYALAAHWRDIGLIPADPPPPQGARSSRVVAASGSCSPVTDSQLQWAAEHDFSIVDVDASKAVDPAIWEKEIARAASLAAGLIGKGRDPIMATARGPDDPAISKASETAMRAGVDTEVLSARIGDGLGRMVDTVLRQTGTGRALISGGDSSGYAAKALGIFALEAIAPLAPGAALFRARSDEPSRDGLELTLKGGQMGDRDFFGRVRNGK